MRRAALAAAVLLAPVTSSAQSLRLVDTTVLEYRIDNQNGIEGDDEFGLGLTKLYLTGQAEDTLVFAHVDGALYYSPPPLVNPIPGITTRYLDQARLERLQVTHTHEDFTLTLGDFPRQVGRGIVLALRKVDELGTDQALRGGQFTYDGPDFGVSTFVGRTNIVNIDGVTLQTLPDPEDTIAGVTTVFHAGSTDIAAHGLFLEPKTPVFEDTNDRTVIGGAYVDTPVTDWLSLYLEGDVSQITVTDRSRRGTAGYASADVGLFGEASLLLEGLYLDQFEVLGSFDPVFNRRNVYNQPPTAERFDQEVLDNQNVRAGRARLSRSFYDGDLVVYVNGMYRQFGPRSAPESNVDAVHGYAGFELTTGNGTGRWFLSGGYREETLKGDVEPTKTLAHAETDWLQPIGGPYSIHLTVFHESRTFVGRPYNRGTSLLALDRAGLGSLTYEIGYDNQNPQFRTFFMAGIVTWEAADWLILRSTVGTQRGGIRCIGGVCRNFPAFAGGRIEATITHDIL